MIFGHKHSIEEAVNAIFRQKSPIFSFGRVHILYHVLKSGGAALHFPLILVFLAAIYCNNVCYAVINSSNSSEKESAKATLADAKVILADVEITLAGVEVTLTGVEVTLAGVKAILSGVRARLTCAESRLTCAESRLTCAEALLIRAKANVTRAGISLEQCKNTVAYRKMICPALILDILKRFMVFVDVNLNITFRCTLSPLGIIYQTSVFNYSYASRKPPQRA